MLYYIRHCSSKVAAWHVFHQAQDEARVVQSEEAHERGTKEKVGLDERVDCV